MKRMGLASTGSWAFDLMVAAMLLTVSLGSLSGPHSLPPGWRGGLALSMLVVHSGILLFRRVAPFGVLAANLASGLVVVLYLGLPIVMLGIGVLVAVYTAASLNGLVGARVVLILSEAAVLAGTLLGHDKPDLSTVVVDAGVVFVLWFLGTTVRSRREHVAKLEARTMELDLAREELAQAAVVEERLRIARELHDILAHSLGTIAVQSGAGAYVIDTKPEEAKRALEAIEGTSRDALQEIRRVVGALRNGRLEGRSPLPTLADLDLLAEHPRSVGMEVNLEVRCPTDDVEEGLQLAAYRVVQEALTNVVRHSGAGSVKVSVMRAPKELKIEVLDDGDGPTGRAAGGYGLIGMRERVETFGGSLETGPGPEGGFRVSARIPLKVGA